MRWQRYITCPGCKAKLRIERLPGPAIQVITQLKCPFCGTVVATVPNGGYRVVPITTGGVRIIVCPNCGSQYLVVNIRGPIPAIYPLRPLRTPCVVCGHLLTHPWSTKLVLITQGIREEPPKPIPVSTPISEPDSDTIQQFMPALLALGGVLVGLFLARKW
jgi:ribosomal protein S27E